MRTRHQARDPKGRVFYVDGCDECGATAPSAFDTPVVFAASPMVVLISLGIVAGLVWMIHKMREE